MKSIKEKQLLVKWSKAMNEPIDAGILEEVERFNSLQNDVLESVRKNTISDLIEAQQVAEQLVAKINFDYPKPPTLDELMSIVQEEANELVQTQPKQISVTEETPTPTPKPAKTLAEKAVQHITKEVKLEEKADSFQQPDPALVEKNLEAVQKKLKFLEQAIGRIAATGPGGGAVNLKDLDDVDYASVVNATNNQVLTFNAAANLWISKTFTDGSGIALTDLSVVVNSANGNGNLSYNNNSGVFSFTPANVSGLSAYSLPTASTTVLGGVKVDGSTITINGNGVITSNYPDTLEELNDTNVAGASDSQVLTYNAATDRWIPTTVNGVDTLPTGIAYYGSFYDTTPKQYANSQTSAYVVNIGQTAETNGVTIADGNKITFAYAGTYEIKFSIQLHNVESGASDVNVWFRKNGTDIPDSNSRFSIPSKNNNNGYLIAVTPFIITVTAGQYVQIVWSSDDNTTTTIETLAAGTTPTVPVTPGVIVLVTPVTALITPTTVDSLTVVNTISVANVIVSGSVTADVWRGLYTSNVIEHSSNIYFTNARVYSNVIQLGYITNSSLAGYATNSQLSLYATNAQVASLITLANVTNSALSNITVAGNTVLNGNVTITKLISANTTGTPTNTSLLNLSASNTFGGAGYADLIKLTNTSGGATLPNKYVRLTSTGYLELINSAYLVNIVSLSDAGNFSVSGDYRVNNKKAVNGPAFRAYVDTNQTIVQGAQRKVTFGTENFDTDGCFANSIFTPTVEGYYQFNSTVRISGTSTAGECMIILYKNGAEYARGNNESGTEQGANFYSMQVSDVAYANGTTDNFEVYIQQVSGGDRATTAGSAISYFSGCMIRGA